MMVKAVFLVLLLLSCNSSKRRHGHCLPSLLALFPSPSSGLYTVRLMRW
jgi:hypothetical protein